MMRSLAECRNRRLMAIAMPERSSETRKLRHAFAVVPAKAGTHIPLVRDDSGDHDYAAPINIPTASTIAPPSTIWNAAWRNGVSM